MATSDPEFEKELLRLIEYTKSKEKNYTVLSYIFYLSAIFFSFLSSILILFKGEIFYLVKKENILIVISSLPAIILMINKNLKFEDKARWFRKKNRIARKYSRILRDLNNPDKSKLAIEFSEQEEELEKEWPTLGEIPIDKK